MTIHRANLLWIAWVILSALAPGRLQDTDAKRMNVLLITADDLGLQLGTYGDDVIETPNLDRLAAHGARFEVAYVTQASCSPSRSSMFTGLYPHANGQYGLTETGASLHPHLRNATIPFLLKSAGYRTGIIGKLHVAPRDGFPFDTRETGFPSRQVRRVARAADRFLGEAGEQRFFLMVSYSDPHASFGDECWECGFPPQVGGLPEDPIEPSAETILPFQGVDSPAQRARTANYYNSVLRLDAGVGMLLDVLERRGHDDDTMVIFLGDHGPAFARGKTTTYEAGLRVPFIVRWPGVSRPLVSQALVTSVDILPTILDAANVVAPPGLHGQSLRRVVGGNDAGWRRYLSGEYHLHHDVDTFYPRRAIRDVRFKLIHNLSAGTPNPLLNIDGDGAYGVSRTPKYDGSSARRAFDTFADPPEYELYDLEVDPWEFDNLAGLAEYGDVQRELTRALMSWRNETDDPFLSATCVEEIAARYAERDRVGRGLAWAGSVAVAVLLLAWLLVRRRRVNS